MMMTFSVILFYTLGKSRGHLRYSLASSFFFFVVYVYQLSLRLFDDFPYIWVDHLLHNKYGRLEEFSRDDSSLFFSKKILYIKWSNSSLLWYMSVKTDLLFFFFSFYYQQWHRISDYGIFILKRESIFDLYN